MKCAGAAWEVELLSKVGLMRDHLQKLNAADSADS